MPINGSDRAYGQLNHRDLSCSMLSWPILKCARPCCASSCYRGHEAKSLSNPSQHSAFRRRRTRRTTHPKAKRMTRPPSTKAIINPTLILEFFGSFAGTSGEGGLRSLTSAPSSSTTATDCTTKGVKMCATSETCKPDFVIDAVKLTAAVEFACDKAFAWLAIAFSDAFGGTITS